MSLISFGEALIDMLPAQTGNLFIPCAGGAPANVAVAYAAQGQTSYFVGGLANDDMANLITQEMTKRGVNLDFCPRFGDANTSLVLVTLNDDGERSFRFYRMKGADTLFTAEHWREALFSSARFFHCCSNTLTSENLFKATLRGIGLARKHNVLVSVDVNLRFNLWPENQLNALPERLDSVLRQAHIIKLEKQELSFILQQAGMNQQQWLNVLWQQTQVKVVLVTDGGNPCFAYTPSQSISVTPPAVEVVDTTGAGDAFIGGFLAQLNQMNDTQRLAQWLTDERLEAALHYACTSGAKACTQKGAFDAMPMADSR